MNTETLGTCLLLTGEPNTVRTIATLASKQYAINTYVPLGETRAAIMSLLRDEEFSAQIGAAILPATMRGEEWDADALREFRYGIELASNRDLLLCINEQPSCMLQQRERIWWDKGADAVFAYSEPMHMSAWPAKKILHRIQQHL